MTRLRWASLVLAGSASLAALEMANAGGFDRGGVNIDQLFDAAPFSAEAGVTYVSPRRTLKNVERQDGFGASSASVDVDGDYAVPRIGFKANLFEPVDCLATYTEPYGADGGFGTGNAYSPTAVEFKVDTRDIGLTCSYKMEVGKGVFRMIGGVSYQEVDAFLSRETLQAFGNPGLGKFQLSDEAVSWRAGAAYEIPEIAFRASLMYSARYNYDGLSGTADSSEFGPTLIPGFPPSMFNPPLTTGIVPATASAEIPQALELKVQSGIAPGWLAFGSLKWQQWSKLDVIQINGVISPLGGGPTDVSFDPLYRDGWTVSGGVGHKFTEKLSGAASITWDRGTSTVSGYQSDTWSFSAGGSYSPTESVEIRLGGSIGVLTSGSSSPSGADQANAVTYEYDDDLLLAGSASVKIKF